MTRRLDPKARAAFVEAMRPLVESTPGVRRRVMHKSRVERIADEEVGLLLQRTNWRTSGASLDQMIDDINADMARQNALLVELGLVDPVTNKLVSDDEIDALVARARRRIEDGKGGTS